jgi:hypothetical protein
MMREPLPGNDRSDATAEVIAFPRRVRAAQDASRVRQARGEPSPVKTMRHYESNGDDDDYRHRMAVNAAAFAACVGLVTLGLWLAIKMADFRRDQDCVLAGRLNCAQVSVLGTPR